MPPPCPGPRGIGDVTIWRPHPSNGLTSNLLQRLLATSQFFQQMDSGAFPEVRVRPGMIADLMPFRKDFPDQFRPAASPFSQEKKCGGNIVLPQDLQQNRRSFRMRAVVKCQRKNARLLGMRNTADHLGKPGEDVTRNLRSQPVPQSRAKRQQHWRFFRPFHTQFHGNRALPVCFQ